MINAAIVEGIEVHGKRLSFLYYNQGSNLQSRYGLGKCFPWYFNLLRMRWKAQKSWCTCIICSINSYGFMVPRAGEEIITQLELIRGDVFSNTFYSD